MKTGNYIGSCYYAMSSDVWRETVLCPNLTLYRVGRWRMDDCEHGLLVLAAFEKDLAAARAKALAQIDNLFEQAQHDLCIQREWIEDRVSRLRRAAELREIHDALIIRGELRGLEAIFEAERIYASKNQQANQT